MRMIAELIFWLLIGLRGLGNFLVGLLTDPLGMIVGFGLLTGFMVVFIYAVRRGRRQRDRG